MRYYILVPLQGDIVKIRPWIPEKFMFFKCVCVCVFIIIKSLVSTNITFVYHKLINLRKKIHRHHSTADIQTNNDERTNQQRNKEIRNEFNLVRFNFFYGYVFRNRCYQVQTYNKVPSCQTERHTDRLTHGSTVRQTTKVVWMATSTMHKEYLKWYYRMYSIYNLLVEANQFDFVKKFIENVRAFHFYVQSSTT